ncbi:hypothetical protein [Hyphomonas sp.]|uniref:hypothetical protein n=1 Tax=Hyphomonas sp. TaxID=87 RepID=UPI0025C023DB|nr:hypothetical protein [Hyphomonas sp.]
MADRPLTLTARSLDLRMSEVKSACDALPPGARKSVSLRRYLSAERAKTSGDTIECSRRLDAALLTLK